MCVVLQGLKYLHESNIMCHGRLKSSNCVVDGRWICKLTDYGMTTFRHGEDVDQAITEDTWFSSKLIEHYFKHMSLVS